MQNSKKELSIVSKKTKSGGGKGISLLFVVLITSVILAISLGISGILIQQTKMMTEIGYSVISFYAADSGIERALYNIRKEEGTGDVLENWGVDYGYSVISGSYNGEAYLKSVGQYKETKRAIETTYRTGLSNPCEGIVDTDWGAGPAGCDGTDKRCFNNVCVQCSGWMNAGYCWYEGIANQSCNDICTDYGGVYKGTCNWMIDCSTCKYWHPNTDPNCYYSPYAPFYRISLNACYGHNSGDYCTKKNSDYVRQCACNY